MFCSQCGAKNGEGTKFCTECGKPLIVQSQSEPIATQPLSPGPIIYQEQKESGAVIAMSVIGFVFGLIGMLGSFIPCLGSLAFYLGIPAAIVSAIGLGIAYSQNARKSFAYVALTISLIGVVISGWQYFSIISAGKNAEEKLNKIFKQPRNENRSYSPSVEDSLANKFCGVWEYNEDGAKHYLKITKERSNRFRLLTGYKSYYRKQEGEILWLTPEIRNSDGIYLHPSNGRLEGQFVSSNFYATHGMEFTYKITLDIKSEAKLLYSVYSSIRGETDEREANKISYL